MGLENFQVSNDTFLSYFDLFRTTFYRSQSSFLLYNPSHSTVHSHPSFFTTYHSQYHNWRRHISHSYLNYQVPKVSSEELLLSRPIRCELSIFAAMATVFFYLHIFTGSVGRRILLVVPVDTLYRTSIISSSTVLPLNPFVNQSLAPLSLFLTYGPDLEVWRDCWVSAESLRTPIPRKGSGSTTTTTTHHSSLSIS